MNVGLAAGLIVAGVAFGATLGFFAGVHQAGTVRALAVLEAQRKFRGITGYLYARRLTLPASVEREIAECTEALYIAAGTAPREVR